MGGPLRETLQLFSAAGLLPSPGGARGWGEGLSLRQALLSVALSVASVILSGAKDLADQAGFQILRSAQNDATAN